MSEVNIQRCPAGHFYDADRYDRCPRCPQAPVTETVLPPEKMAGWLVCIGGPEPGRDFRLYPGYNYIGCGQDADICIQGYPAIQMPHTAVLGYDDRMNLFSFGSCGGRSAVRVNDKMILDAVILAPYDRLSVGETTFLFVPLCGPQFRWDAPDHPPDVL